MLFIYNTLTEKKEEFIPIVKKYVRIYVCGITVYDFCHIGHARVNIVFDMLRRWLNTLNYTITYVQNITDIDDKIIKAANQQNISTKELTDYYIQAMHKDMNALGVIAPDHEPHATHYIAEMIEMIQKLKEQEFAYLSSNGDVLFSVDKFPAYGCLGKQELSELRQGSRNTKHIENKHNALDFVLWKKAKPGEPSWESPWGEGRPGWHIECSAMSQKILGNYFDIHGGGIDLKFPHHENEHAQSCAAHGSLFVKYWMHNGFVKINNEKMSKSLGNSLKIRDVLKKYPAEVLRFFILRTHYRSPIVYTDNNLCDAKNSLSRLYRSLSAFSVVTTPTIDWTNPYAQRFRKAMNNDLSTSNAIAILFELASTTQKNHSFEHAQLLKSLGNTIGLLDQDPQSFLQDKKRLTQEEILFIETSIEERNKAKKEKNFKKADQIRTDLLQKNIVLEDTTEGVTTWRLNSKLLRTDIIL